MPVTFALFIALLARSRPLIAGVALAAASPASLVAICLGIGLGLTWRDNSVAA